MGEITELFYKELVINSAINLISNTLSMQNSNIEKGRGKER